MVICLNQFHIDVCVWMVIYLAKCFIDFPIIMEEAKMMPDPVSLILVVSRIVIIITCPSFVVSTFLNCPHYCSFAPFIRKHLFYLLKYIHEVWKDTTKDS